MIEIALTRNKVTFIDDADYDLVSDYKWYACQSSSKLTWYAQTHHESVPSMHRLILGLDLGDSRTVDHKDRNGLNNVRSNLRLATISQQLQNRRTWGKSKYKGVSAVYGRWQARIKGIYLGLFDTEIEAALAYDKAALEMFGEYAKLNQPSIDLAENL